jgi:putative membrane protein
MMATLQTTQSAPKTNWIAVIEGCIFVGIGAMLLRKTWDGQLPLYIHPRYTALIAITATALLLIGAVRLWQTSDGEDGIALRTRVGVYGLLLAPLLLGVLIPAKPAGSALVDPKLLSGTGRGYRTTNAIATDDSTQWTLVDWMFARYTLKPEEARGKPVDVIGFVYHAPDQPADELHVVRYTLACCVADRTVVSLPVKSAQGAALTDNQWIRVTGTIDTRPVADGPDELYVADAKIEVVPQPEEPYLYP